MFSPVPSDQVMLRFCTNLCRCNGIRLLSILITLHCFNTVFQTAKGRNTDKSYPLSHTLRSDPSPILSPHPLIHYPPSGSSQPIHVDSVTTSCLSLSLLSTIALTAALLLWPSGVAAHLTHLHAAPGLSNTISIPDMGLVIQRVFVSAPSAAAVRSLSLAMVAAVLLPLAAALQAVKVLVWTFVIFSVTGLSKEPDISG